MTPCDSQQDYAVRMLPAINARSALLVPVVYPDEREVRSPVVISKA